MFLDEDTKSTPGKGAAMARVAGDRRFRFPAPQCTYPSSVACFFGRTSVSAGQSQDDSDDHARRQAYGEEPSGLGEGN